MDLRYNFDVIERNMVRYLFARLPVAGKGPEIVPVGESLECHLRHCDLSGKTVLCLKY